VALFGGRMKTTPAVLPEGELPEWLAAYFLYRRHPEPGTVEARILDGLYGTARRTGLTHLTKLAAVWRLHQDKLLARWAAEGCIGEPHGAHLARDPYNPDPRVFLTQRYERAWWAGVRRTLG
jgi:hypothetical protein